jgi:hypothetical protein
LTAIQRSDQSYSHFEPLLKPGATSPHHHRVSIPHPLHAKGHPETPASVSQRSNGRIKSYGHFEPLIKPGAIRPHRHRVSILIHSMQKGIRKLQEEFHRDPTVGSKVMDISNRYSSVARPDLKITEYPFLIHPMEKGIRKLQ